MSLDVSLLSTVFDLNITHNLGKMAKEAGIYYELWRPEELDVYQAQELIAPLERGLKRLLDDPEHYKNLNPENGWGNYDNLVQFVTQYLQACKENPYAIVRVSR